MKTKEIIELAKELHTRIGYSLTLQECHDFIKKVISKSIPDEKEEIKDICNCSGNITGKHNEFCKFKNRIYP